MSLLNTKETLYVTVKFDIAHRLIDHDGKCSRLHGHSMKARIYVTGINEVRKNSMFLVDIVRLENKIKEIIDRTLDHRTIIQSNDPIMRLLENESIFKEDEVVIMEPAPTMENLAIFMFSILDSEIEEMGLKITKIVLNEGNDDRGVIVDFS